MTQHLKVRVTVALSHHRPEVVRPATDLMADHEAVFLEEPPSQELNEMLRGDIPIENYVAVLDTEYPEFSFRMAAALRKLSANGKKIFAVESYLAHLIEIHELFADGGSPADLQPDTPRQRVYLAEHSATGALLAFYEAAARGSFSRLIRTVKAFARQDAHRFVLRDRLRRQNWPRLSQITLQPISKQDRCTMGSGAICVMNWAPVSMCDQNFCWT